MQTPCKFYAGGKIQGETGTISFQITKCEKTLCIQQKEDAPDRSDKMAHIPVHLVGVCEDRLKRCFVAVAPYLDYKTLNILGFGNFPSDFDRDNELVQQLETEFLDISLIRGFSYTLCCTRDQFHQKKVGGTLPQGAPVNFCRYVYSAVDNVIIGERTRIHDPYADSGVLHFSDKVYSNKVTVCVK